MAPTSFIPELESVLEHGSDEKRAEALRKITALFLEGASIFNDDHVRLFDDVFVMLIAEIENYGKPNQHELPPGHDAGYLWRLNGYWRLEQRDNGVYLECEAISLTRSLPALLSALFAPAMHGLESETMSNTLQQTRDAVRK